MRWILTRRRRLPLALAVVLACAPPSAMPSRLLMTVAVKGLQSFSADSLKSRRSHSKCHEHGPTEQAGLIYDCLEWLEGGRRGQGRDSEGAKGSEGERRRARESEGSGREK